VQSFDFVYLSVPSIIGRVSGVGVGFQARPLLFWTDSDYQANSRPELLQLWIRLSPKTRKPVQAMDAFTYLAINTASLHGPSACLDGQIPQKLHYRLPL
jgi:hypothetical protein